MRSPIGSPPDWIVRSASRGSTSDWPKTGATSSAPSGSACRRSLVGWRRSELRYGAKSRRGCGSAAGEAAWIAAISFEITCWVSSPPSSFSAVVLAVRLRIPGPPRRPYASTERKVEGDGWEHVPRGCRGRLAGDGDPHRVRRGAPPAPARRALPAGRRPAVDDPSDRG